MDPEIITTISNSIALVKRLREVSKNVGEAEFKNLLADLASELADAKLEAAHLKEELASLREENRMLRQVKAPPEEAPSGVKWGCYQFEEVEGLFCTACWDSKRMRSRTNRIDSRFRRCPVCEAVIGSG